MTALGNDSISVFAESDDNKIVLSVNIPPGNKLFLRIVYEELLLMRDSVYTLQLNSIHARSYQVEIEEGVPIDSLSSTGSSGENTTVWKNDRKRVEMAFEQSGPLSVSYNTRKSLDRNKREEGEISTHVDMAADGSFVYHIVAKPLK